MNITNKLGFWALCTLAGLNVYFLLERQQLLADDDTPIAVATAPGLSEIDVVRIVDERLASLDKRQAKAWLSQEHAKLQHAAESVPDNKLLYGNLSAPITLQVYADIECPFCRRMHAGLKQVIDHSQGTINWEFRHFPLASHNPAAAIEAQAIECIAELYDNRTAWIALGKFVQDTGGNGRGVGDIPTYVRSFGINGTRLDYCLSSDSHKDKINQDYGDGLKLGVVATPSVRVINNQTGRSMLLRGEQSAEQLLAAVQQVM